jgi:hypothetical protein
MYRGVFWYVGPGFLLIVLILQWARDEKRTRMIQNFASNKGLAFLGDSLPRRFPLQQISSRLARSISRVVTGDQNDKDVLLFDCRLGRGKGSSTGWAAACAT